jgi:hypothetical protein
VRLTLLACAIALAGGACGGDHDLQVEKRRLARLPSAWRRPSIHVAEGGDRVTYAVGVPDGFYVATSAGRGTTYTGVTPPHFAAASERVFYWATRQEGGRERHDVVAGDAVLPTPFRAPGDLVASRGGTRWAARGRVVDEAPGTDRTAILVDGREVGRYAAASRPSFSRDGAHVTWVAQDDGGRTSVLVDGEAVRSVDAVARADGARTFDALAGATYLSDGRLLTLLPEGDRWTIRRGDERLATYAHVVVPGEPLRAGPDTGPAVATALMAVAPEAPVVVWWERLPGDVERWRVVRDGAPVDGIECARPWETEAPTVSADGTHVAYVCPGPVEADAPLGRRRVVLDGRRFGPYLETWTLGLSADGSQVAYGAAEALPVQSWRIFVNGAPRTAPQELVWRPRFSPDGTRLVWAGGPERSRRRLAIDRRTVTRFDNLVYGPEFPDPRTAVWVIRRGRSLSRIEARF